MAFQTSHIGTDTGAQLFVKETTVLVVAIRTFHTTFGHFVMERAREGGFLFGMARVAEVRLSIFEKEFCSFRCMGSMAIKTGDALFVVLTAAEVEAFLAAALLALVTFQAAGCGLC